MAIDLGANRKHICNFLFLIKSNFIRICYRFRDIGTFCSKIACFPHPPLFDTPSGGTPCDINVICTLLESTFSGLLFCRVYGYYGYIHSFSRCCHPKSQNHAKFRQKLDLTAVQGHPRSSILMSIESSYVTFY